jgi:hypothetical protein
MKKIMKKTLFGVFGALALTLTFGANLKQDAVVNAQTITPSTTLYLRPGSQWRQGGAKFAAYFYTGTAPGVFKWMTPVSGEEYIYSANPDANFENVIFTRHAPDTVTPAWDANKWNQTADLTYVAPKDLFVVPDAAPDQPWDGADNTNWQVYNPDDWALPPEFPANTELYIRVNATFMGTADGVKGYFFNGANNVFVDAVQVDTDVYKVTSPTLAGGVLPNYLIFVSTEGEAADPWTTKVNQTADLTYDSTNGNLYDFATTAWQNYTEPTPVVRTATTEGVDANKVRIWVNRGGHYEDGFEYLLHVEDTYYAPTGYTQALLDGAFFVYFDVDQTAVTFNQVGLTVVNNLNVKQVDIPAQQFVESDNSSLWTVNYDEGTETWSYEKTFVTGRVLNTFLAKVLEGYLSCSPRLSNGYEAFPYIDSAFIPRKLEGDTEVWDVEGNLDTVMINDFATEADYATGTRGVEIDAYTKYAMLQANYNAAHGGGAVALNNVTRSNPLIISLFFISVVGLSLVIFVSNRKKNFAK